MAVKLEISVSLDGFVAGPNPTLEQPLGEGGDLLHEWALGLRSWREPHGLSGGATGVDDELVRASRESTGAVIMGRLMFSGGVGPWADDANATGWWGDDPPFGVPVFVLTHHERELLPMQGGTSFTFVTDGIESALEQARAAAGERDVLVAGGASAAQQYLAAGLLDELLLHVVPVLLGGGTRLFERAEPGRLELVEVIDSPTVSHLRYHVPK
jgi:dihydrofolate reductase